MECVEGERVLCWGPNERHKEVLIKKVEVVTRREAVAAGRSWTR